MDYLLAHKLRWVGVGVAALYWVLEAFLDTLDMNSGFGEQLLPDDPNELWMRGIIAGFFVVCGFSAQAALDRRKRYEAKLRESEERTRAILETTPDAVITMTSDGVIRSFNPGAERVFGHAAEEVVGRPLRGLMPERFRGPHEAGLHRYLGGGEPRVVGKGAVRLAGLRKDGTEFPLELSLGEMREEDGILFTGIVRDVTERKEAEEALREGEERYRLVARATNEAIWDSDLVADRQTWDGAIEEMFGYPAGIVTDGAWWEEHIHPEDRGRVVSGIEEVLGGAGDTWSDEYRFRCADGGYSDVVDRGYVVRGAGGEVVRVIGSMMDVTERRRAEEEIRVLNEDLERRVAERTQELERAEQKYRSIFENAVEGIFQTSVEGRLLTANPAMARMLGYGSPEELLASVSDVGNQLYVEPARRAVFGEMMRRHGSVSGFEAEFYRKDGSRVWASFSARDVRGEDGELVGYEGTVEDITERRRADEALRESEAQYRAVVEQTAEGLFLFDAESKRIVETNPAFQRLLGYSAQELSGMVLYDLIAEDPESVDRNVRRNLELGQYRVGERRYRRKDGSVVEVEVSGSVISFGGREVVCALARDITERKRGEQARREILQAERGRIARELHDRALQDITYASAEAEIVQLLSEDAELGARLGRAIEALKRGGRHLREAVYDLRLEDESGRPFSKLLESLVEQNRAMAPGCEIRLAVQDGFPQVPLRYAGTELLRVFQEALSNVRRHSGASSVRLALGVEGDDLVAEVADDGRGFFPETAPGIGFSSMRERVSALGGKLEVESKPGEGTRVRFRVPLSGMLRAASGTGGHGEGQ